MSSLAIENKYVVGDLVKLTARFQDPVSKEYLSPTEVSCEVMDPAGTTVSYTPTHNSSLQTPDGLTADGYFVEIDVELPGTWYYRFASTGVGQAAQEGAFYVERSAFAS